MRTQGQCLKVCIDHLEKVPLCNLVGVACLLSRNKRTRPMRIGVHPTARR